MGYKKSVILPVFNGEKFINRALESIKKQTLQIDEVVIINDSSVDSTEKLVKTWNEKLPIKYYFNDKNKGAALSLKIGLLKAKGDIIFHLDHDDEWHPNHVKNLMNIFLSNPELDLVSAKTSILRDNKEITQSDFLSNKNIRSKLMWDNPIVHSAAAFKKTSYFKTNGYGLEKVAHDYKLWVGLLKNGNYAFSHKVSCNYYIIGNSLSRNYSKTSIKERINIQWLALFYFGFRNQISFWIIFPILFLRTIRFL